MNFQKLPKPCHKGDGSQWSLFIESHPDDPASIKFLQSGHLLCIFRNPPQCFTYTLTSEWESTDFHQNVQFQVLSVSKCVIMKPERFITLVRRNDCLFQTPRTQHAISQTCKYRPCQPSLTITFPKWGMQTMQLLAPLSQTRRATTHMCAHTDTHTHTHTHTFILQTFIKRTACDHNCDSGLHQWVKYFQLCHNCDFTFKIRAVNSCSHTNTHLRHTHTHTHTHTHYFLSVLSAVCVWRARNPHR